MSKDKTDVLHGSLAFMVLRTLDTLGPQHGWGIARRIEQISGDALELNQGSLYPALLRLQQMGWIPSKGGASDNNRGAGFTPSRGPARSSSPPKPRTGSELPESCHASQIRRGNHHDKNTRTFVPARRPSSQGKS